MATAVRSGGIARGPITVSIMLATVMQVLDTTTRQTLEVLAAAGMISIHTRATRPLLSTSA